MKKLNLNSLAILTILVGLVLYSCSSGGNRDIAPEPFNINNVSGDWLFDSECDEYVLGLDTIYLAQQLPDTITINSDTDSAIFIDAGTNNLVANVDLNGNFIIPNQTFLASRIFRVAYNLTYFFNYFFFYTSLWPCYFVCCHRIV